MSEDPKDVPGTDEYWNKICDEYEAKLEMQGAAIRVLLEACEDSAWCCSEEDHGLGEAIKAGEAALALAKAG